jgi:hypothetical protein
VNNLLKQLKSSIESFKFSRKKLKRISTGKRGKSPSNSKMRMSCIVAMRPAIKNANPDASFGDLLKMHSDAYHKIPYHELQVWKKK